MTTEVGNGANTKFWKNGCSIFWPLTYSCTRKRRVIRRTVQKALPDNAWLQNIQGHYSVLVLAELLNIWDLVEQILHQPEVEDLHKWRFEASGQFSTESAYEALFNGAIHFEPSKLIWSTWAPSKCNFFSLVGCTQSLLDSRQARKLWPSSS